MRVLLLHNYYLQPGGEDQVFAEEARLLANFGHQVHFYIKRSADLAGKVGRMPSAALSSLWSASAFHEVARLVANENIDIAHFHNTFPLISPAAYYSVREKGVPVIQTLHNYRLLCPSAIFYRSGQVCESCMKRLIPWPGILHACYRQSRAATTAVSAVLFTHKLLGTWTRAVDVYIALTDFARSKYIEAGFPPDKILVKPNFLAEDPGVGKHDQRFALFVGRLTKEKGVGTLLSAWQALGNSSFLLKIVGDGPLSRKVEELVRRAPNIEWLGRLPRDRVFALMKRAAFLVFPSEWYEGFPMTIVEAFATGLPVIASDLGAMSTLIESGRTGLHFQAGEPADLAAKVDWLLANTKELSRMQKEARAEYETKYTAERNHKLLMDIYEYALERVQGQ